jgi:glutamate/aspartate transport system permease protein
MHYNWNWRIFWELSPDGVHTYWDTLMSGLAWTLATSLAGWVIALALGITVGMLRTVPNRWVRRLAIGWVEVFRNIPLLVQMFLWFFVLPELLPSAAGEWLKALPNAPFVTAVLCLGFFTSARVAVQVAAGISALAGGQRLAALAIGLTGMQAYRYILLPLGLRIVLPPLASEFLNIIKNSSVALTIGLMELTASARSMQEFSFQFFEAFAAATMIYVIANIIVVAGMTLLERKVALRGTLGEASADSAQGRA